MQVSKRVTFTDRQVSALRLLKSRPYVLLDGGAQSGKTRVILEWMIRKGLRHPGLRMFAGRAMLTDAKASLWRQSLPQIIDSYKSPGLFSLNNTDLIVTMPNGSQLYVDGFDDKERIEKILGRGFAIIYLNECSQIEYRAYTTAKTRKSQVIPGFTNQMLFDCNPPAPSHWIHKLFYEKIEAKEGKPLANPEDYAELLMNPADNQENLPADYIASLDDLPDEEMRRFKLGEYVKPSGAIFKELDRVKHTMPRVDIPVCDRYAVGVDLVTYAALLIGFTEYATYVVDEYGAQGFTAGEMNEVIYEMWGEYDYIAYLDHNLGEAATREFINSTLSDKGPGSVEASINLIRQLLKADELYIADHCTGLLYEMENYRRDDLGRIVKVDDHYISALRYGVYSEVQHEEPSVSYVQM